MRIYLQWPPVSEKNETTVQNSLVDIRELGNAWERKHAVWKTQVWDLRNEYYEESMPQDEYRRKVRDKKYEGYAIVQFVLDHNLKKDITDTEQTVIKFQIDQAKYAVRNTLTILRINMDRKSEDMKNRTKG